MKTEQLKKYLMKKVKIELFDGDIIEGYLRRTGESDFKNNPNLYTPKNYYFLTDGGLNCISYLFRVSHIVKLDEVHKLSECCENCMYLNIGKCTNNYIKRIKGTEFLAIEDSENSKCEFYKDSRCC